MHNDISELSYINPPCLFQVSMNSAISLIKKAAESGANITEVYVDTVGPPEKYQAKLSEIFPNYKITVSIIT